ncbi:hypothetical protein WJX81_000587 [Elliptochloris bilobata]|uniref:Uncharacterized protein n=1 Tax=Elliptochloris bilobata TaxID=381761 RepID=A0AAW1R186_9CHLO
MKKLLSSIPEAPMNVECMMNDLDFRSMMSREKFEELAQPVLERAKAPLAKALAEAGVSVESLASVEVVGGSSRVPALMRILRDFFGREPSRTLNATECVSRGCALNCAMLSPIFRVRDFEVIDAFPFGIQFTWEKDGEPTTTVLFERNGPIPSAKMLTFFRNQQFTLTAAYTEDSPLPEGFDRTIGTFTIGPPAHVPSDSEAKAKLKVKVRLNLHGVISVENAQQIEEEEYEETVRKAPAVVDAEPMDEPMAEAGADEKMNDAAAAGESGAASAAGPSAAEQNGQADAGSADAAGAAAAAAEGDAGPMEADAAAAAGPKPAAEEVEVVKKKRTKKLAVPHSAQTAGLSQAAVQALIEREAEYALQDRRQEETNEKKNALEAYVYSLRDKLAVQLRPFATESEVASLTELLDHMENWLYDEGEDEKKSVYVAKLDQLRAAGEPIARRHLEAAARPTAAAHLAATIDRLKAAATSSDAKLAHIPQADKDQVVTECDKAAKWLAEKQAAQASLRQTDSPVLTAEDIRKREGTVLRFCEPLLSKPPPPPKEEKKGEAKPEENVEAMDTDAGGAAAEAMDAGEEAPPSAGKGPQPTSVEEPMEA